MGISDDIVPRNRYRAHSIHHIDIKPSKDEFLDFEEQKAETVKTNVSEKTVQADDFFDKKEATKEPVKKSRPNKKLWGWICGILVFCLIGYFIFSNYKSIVGLFKKTPSTANTATNNSTDNSVNNTVNIEPQDYTTPDSSSTTQEETTPSVTPSTSTADATKSSLKIQVLNGNGTSGSASVMKKTLETAGFTISSSGNAKNFNYQNTIIYYKTGKESGANLVKDAITNQTVTLEQSDTIVKTYDIIVVVGKT